MQLREIGIRKCEEKNLPLPTWLKEPPPPPPEPFQDEDVGDVSAEMIQHETAEASESFNLERSLAQDQVPLADPEVELTHRTPLVNMKRGYLRSIFQTC
jgi:serine/threonine-protein phosphatase 2A regulatory subunit B'